MTARRRSGLGTAAVLMSLVAVMSGVGCSPEESPPATVREYREPTETVSQGDLEPGGSSDATGGPLSPELRREFEAQVKVVDVGYGADGAYLVVYFVAPPRLAVLWQPGELYVVDEATGAKYSDIPFMPKIGRLIGRPVAEGQRGYVMLENTPRLEPGAQVTVVLGGFRQSHVTVEQTASPAPPAP